ncbi:MAG: YwbE family protein [Bacteroidetes bacterium]|nr:YwbE family protein [Bacteroidota bacterium]
MESNNKAHYRENIRLGMEVAIVLKKDQKTGKRTLGKVQWILTSAPYHSRGIKVQLVNRQVGRVQEIISAEA